MSPVLSVEALSLAAGEKRLLDAVSFSIRKGETFALVGESGSGKSLSALAIMRLLPQAVKVSGGDVLLHGSSLFGLPEYRMQKVRGRKIAMIFQEPMSALNPVMTVGEQVAEVLRLHLNLSASEAKARVISLFEEVALPDAATRYGWYPHQLSGGQKQRVMIAMALACEPDLLIADEPTTALDVTVQAQVLALLGRIQKQRKLSILFITHDMAVVSQVADRVAVMWQGRIVESAEASHFFTAPQHPYTKRLLADALGEKGYRETPAGERLLEVKDLKVHFPVKKGLFQRTAGYIKAVDGVSLEIAKGETLALVGESGSGKSTLGQAILSLVPIREGEISFAGQCLNGLSRSALKPYRQKIQVIFQDPFSALDPRMSVGDILREGMESLGTGPKDRADQDAYLRELLQKVDLDPESLTRYPHEFSGGQRQRIGIARALAVSPELIICDEPTSALDVTVRAQVLALLKRIQEETGVSYLFITHDLSLIETIADKVAVMREGKIVEQGRVKEVMRHPSHPYTRTLLEAAPKLPEIKQREK
jgi:peptide/nickel transport system ATP-binding protein